MHMAEQLHADALAKKVGVTRDTILTWARRGWIPCERSGRRPVFDPKKVDQALRKRRAHKGVMVNAD